VDDASDLRPTPDRIRETLFNWLQPVIAGAECLDLFSGSGALGFEALSRGAGHVVMLEQNRTLTDGLLQQARALGTDKAEIINCDALKWLQSATNSFDLVFLDPPFDKNLVPKACELLVNRGHLRPDALVYVESEPGIEADGNIFRIHKQSRAGQVQYMLLGQAREKQEE